MKVAIQRCQILRIARREFVKYFQSFVAISTLANLIACTDSPPSQTIFNPATGGEGSGAGGVLGGTGGIFQGTGGAIGSGGVIIVGPTGGVSTGGVQIINGSGGGGIGAGGATADAGSGGDSGNAQGSGGDAGTGSVQVCDQSPPPDGVSAWIDESWNAQLGDNIRSRSAWLLDSVMKGDGHINLCVRWGATSAPSDTVKAQLASSVESWFNDWFTALGDYDCFPYGQGIAAKITGWAVKPGNESWVSELGSDIAVYTETDGDGEPKCPDVCSFFENWSHEFPNCPGGEAFHTDYWIWVDDQLPGGGGAGAVGGDWGLRMPVATLVGSLGKSGDHIIEHEMGHGFGFQDYYDWTGSTPDGGSLMIVGSQGGGVPTVGDTWLLRRTWSEMRDIRGW